MQVAVVGAGHWGKNLVRVFSDILSPSHVTVCDLVPERLDDIKQWAPGVRTTQYLSAVLDDPAIQAVVVATPTQTHGSLAARSLEAGKHVLVEKPMAISSRESELLVRLANAHDKILMVDHLLLYHPALLRIQELIYQGELGEVLHVYCQRVNLGIVRSEENALWSLGAHDISVVLRLMDEWPATVSAHGGRYVQADVEDIVYVVLGYSSGRMAHLHLSWIDPHKVRRVTVIGRCGMLVFDDDAPGRLRLFGRRVDPDSLRTHDTGVRTLDVDSKEPIEEACRHFLDCVLRHQRPRSDGLDGWRVVRILEAAQRSLEAGGKPVSPEAAE